MSWKQKLTDSLSDTCRFCARAGILIDLILLSLLSVWFVFKFVLFSRDWLNRTLFSQPW